MNKIIYLGPMSKHTNVEVDYCLDIGDEYRVALPDSLDIREHTIVVAQVKTPFDFYVLLQIGRACRAKGITVSSVYLSYLMGSDPFKGKIGNQEITSTLDIMGRALKHSFGKATFYIPYLPKYSFNFLSWYINIILDSYTLVNKLLLSNDKEDFLPVAASQENKYDFFFDYFKEGREGRLKGEDIPYAYLIRGDKSSTVGVVINDDNNQIKGRNTLVVEHYVRDADTLVSIAKEIKRLKPNSTNIYVTYVDSYESLVKLSEEYDKVFMVESNLDIIKELLPKNVEILSTIAEYLDKKD